MKDGLCSQERIHDCVLSNLLHVGTTIVQPPEDVDDFCLCKAHIDEAVHVKHFSRVLAILSRLHILCHLLRI